MAAQVRAAIAAGRRVHLRYYVPGRDEATERDVDPMRLLVVDGRTYLEGWCLPRRGRCGSSGWTGCWSLAVLDQPATLPAEAEPVDVDQGLFRPSPDDLQRGAGAVARRDAGSPSTTRASRCPNCPTGGCG